MVWDSKSFEIQLSKPFWRNSKVKDIKGHAEIWWKVKTAIFLRSLACNHLQLHYYVELLFSIFLTRAIRFRSSIPFTSDTGQCTHSRALPGNGTAQKTAEIFNRPMILNRNRALKKNDASKQKLKVTSIWQIQHIAVLLETWSHPAAPDKHHHSIRLNSFGQFGATSWKWLSCCMMLYRSMGTFDYLLTPEEWDFNGTAE